MGANILSYLESYDELRITTYELFVKLQNPRQKSARRGLEFPGSDL